MDHDPVSKLQRRVAGFHSIRMDGIIDLVMRAKGATVMDVGCNRGLVGLEMYFNGARLVHGCDNWDEGIQFCRHLFADFRDVRSQFETVDLSKGPSSLKPFGHEQYDIVLLLAVVHKLKRAMPEKELHELLMHFGTRTRRYLGWRGQQFGHGDHKEELKMLERAFKDTGLVRVHYSEISEELGPAAIWQRRRA